MKARTAARCGAWIALMGAALLAAGHAARADGPEPAMEREIAQRINTIRREHHLSELRTNPDLARIAREHSREMAEKGFFDHTSPTRGSFSARVQSTGLRFSSLGENIAKNAHMSDPVGTVVRGWMESTGHRHNILTPEFTDTGVGVWKRGNAFYFTQDFIQAGGPGASDGVPAVDPVTPPGLRELAAEPVVQHQSAPAMEARLLRSINALRGERHLPPLRLDSALSRIAREYSREKVRRTPSASGSDGRELLDRVRAARYRFARITDLLYSSAGIADPALAALRGWTDDPGSRRALLDPDYTDAGLGVSQEGDSCYLSLLLSHPM